MKWYNKLSKYPTYQSRLYTFSSYDEKNGHVANRTRIIRSQGEHRIHYSKSASSPFFCELFQFQQTWRQLTDKMSMKLMIICGFRATTRKSQIYSDKYFIFEIRVKPGDVLSRLQGFNIDRDKRCRDCVIITSTVKFLSVFF